MNYLVIDLEMCQVPRSRRTRDFRYASEIIEVGAVLLDEQYHQIGSLCQYVRPEYGFINPFIEELTGIHSCQVNGAPLLEETLNHLLDWLGDRECKVFAWSKSDHCQLMHEIRSKHIDDARIAAFMAPENWVDYQDIYMKRFDLTKAISLADALYRAELEPEGRLHDGLADAANTGRLIRKLELNPEYRIREFCYSTGEEESFGFNLGSLFNGLNLQIA